MSVKSKFKCVAITELEGQKEVRFNAVCSSKGENADFCKYTPFGEHKQTIDKDAPAADYFKVGKSYYLTFEEAPEE